MKQARIDPLFLAEKTVPSGCQRSCLQPKMVVHIVLNDRHKALKQVGHVHVAEEHRTIHRRLLGLVARVDICAVIQEQPGHIHKTADRREIKRRGLVVITTVDVRAVGQQQLGNLEVTILGGVVQSRLAGPVVHRVDVCAVDDVGLDRLDVVSPTGRRPDRQLRPGLSGNNPPQRETKEKTAESPEHWPRTV